MRKAIVLSFLLLANLIVLAHGIIPHHQHEPASKCCMDFHCTDNNDNQNPNTEKCCFLDDNYTSARSNTISACHIHSKCSCGQVEYSLIQNSLNTHDFIDKKLIRLRHKPYIPLFYSVYVSRSLGLRAPPYLIKN